MQNVMHHKGHYDAPLLAAILALVVGSVVMVYSSSSVVALTTYDDPAFFMKRQIMWAVLGLALMAVTMRIDHRYVSGQAGCARPADHFPASCSRQRWCRAWAG